MAHATIKAHGKGKIQVFFGNRGGVGFWSSFGMREVSKALGFATTIVFCTQLVDSANRNVGRVPMNPLYPTYKSLTPPRPPLSKGGN